MGLASAGSYGQGRVASLTEVIARIDSITTAGREIRQGAAF
jgi:hypothetical protein